MLNDAKEILKQYEKAVIGDVDVCSIEGVILIIEGNIDKAEKILKNGLYRYGENFDILFNLGFLYENTGRKDLAIEYYKRALINTDKREMIEKAQEKLIILGVKDSKDAILDSFQKNKPKGKLKVAFFPYKISMWDSLETIYEAALEDKDCIVDVVPIPYHEKSIEELTFKYEGDRFSNVLNFRHYTEYNIEYEKPDIVFVHNIYDQNNTITRVYEKYFTSYIKKHTRMLVYVPYHIPSFFSAI
mgnify:CR=1 FL=1